MPNFHHQDSIKIPDSGTIEEFVSQFQKSTTDILCIQDGKSVMVYNHTGSLVFLYKKNNECTTEYYFQDEVTKSTYCVFGKRNAKVLYSQTKNKETIVITDRGRTHTFFNPDYPVLITPKNIDANSH